MQFSHLLAGFSLLVATGISAQEIQMDSYKEEIKNSMIDYLDVQNRQFTSYLDSIKENIDPEMEVNDEVVQTVRRMKMASKIIPLEYNSQVAYYIDKYTSSNWRPYMNRLMGLSQHYFKIYERIFKDEGLPDEIKYLSLVESSLNPHLVSSAGAVGPWQFMYATAKIYDLEMDSYVDERKDAYASSYAVTKYLKEAHDQFDDWLLAIASYNCGRGCVQRAIQRSGMTAPSFWELSPFLPQETRNYVPKFIAMTYVLSTSTMHGIEPVSTELDLESKLHMLNKRVDLSHVADALSMSLADLKKYNPSYKRNIINGTVEHPRRLLLPLTSQTNDSLLYVALNTPSSFERLGDDDKEESVRLTAGTPKTYTVKKGETLALVSRRFGVSVQNLMAWNGLSAKSAVIGQNLILERPVDSRLAQNIKKVSAKSKTVTYVVKKGDSLERIANNHKGATVSKLKADNNLKGNLIKPGMRLTIK